MFDSLCFFLLFIFVVTNVDFLAWQTSRVKFMLVLDMLRVFIHAGDVKTNCFYADHFRVGFQSWRALRKQYLMLGMAKISYINCLISSTPL